MRTMQTKAKGIPDTTIVWLDLSIGTGLFTMVFRRKRKSLSDEQKQAHLFALGGDAQ